MPLTWKEHYAKYHDTYIKKSRRYYKTHREEILAQKKAEYRNLSPAQRARKLAQKRAAHAKNPEKHREQQRKWRATDVGKLSRAMSRLRERQKLRANPQLDRARHLRVKYGMTLQHFNDLVARQDGKCAICGSAKRLVVDHDHNSGLFRGIVCYTCNTGIGHIERFISGGLKEKLAAYMNGGNTCL